VKYHVFLHELSESLIVTLGCVIARSYGHVHRDDAEGNHRGAMTKSLGNIPLGLWPHRIFPNFGEKFTIIELLPQRQSLFVHCK